MRLITFHITALIAGTVYGVWAAPGGPARGSALSKLRRAAEAVDELLEGPIDTSTVERDPGCYVENGACDLVRREAATIADAIAEAQAQSQTAAYDDGGISSGSAPAAAAAVSDGWCHAPGGYCDKMKREADVLEARALALGADEAHIMKRNVNADYDDAVLQNCKRPGQPCNVARGNFGDTIRKLADKYKGKSDPKNAGVPDTTFVGVQHDCHRRGEPCFKLKRAIDLIADLSAEDVDELSENDRRSIDPARRALSDIGKMVARRQKELTESGILM